MPSILPASFLWGFATASYQIEGASDVDGRADSIWDVFCRKSDKIADGSDGSVACDSYHRYKEDVALLKSLGAKAYRFSVSWSRVIPRGGRKDEVNEKGLQYYKSLVEELLSNGIEPMVTLFHWDLPAALDERYGGFLNKDEYVQDYVNYAKVMFTALPKVKYWITYNEPWCTTILGYASGLHAPGRTSDRSKSPQGDSGTEPWIVGHNILIAHGAAVKLYREEFKPKSDGGVIGMTLNGDWAEPWDPNDREDVDACERKLEFTIGWFGDVLYKGEYPQSMRQQLGDRLPTFSEAEIALVKGSNDFYGMNHYCANYIRHKTTQPEREDNAGNLDILFENKKGESIGPLTQSQWLRPYPSGFRDLLVWISKRYGKPTIYVTENGTSLKGENDLSTEDILQDDFRAEYFRNYINALTEAVTLHGVDCRGYMAWSLLDNFEWAEGYETRFGVTFVDYKNGQKRHAKKSAKVVAELFSSICKG